MNQVLIHAEPTSNPNAVRFTLNRPLNGEKTCLCQALHSLTPIQNIEITGNSITIFKQPDSDWGNLIPHVEKVILENIRANE